MFSHLCSCVLPSQVYKRSGRGDNVIVGYRMMASLELCYQKDWGCKVAYHGVRFAVRYIPRLSV